MGTHFLPLFTSLTITPLPFSFTSANPNNPKFSNPVGIRLRSHAVPRYDSKSDNFRSGRSKFSLDDEFSTDDEVDFDFGSSAKQRSWWSDESEDIDDEDEEEFPIFKVLGAFGWIVPAIGISMLLGTGPNALFMAIVLPLGQSVLSLAIDKVWGKTDRPRPRPRPRSRSRTKKRPFTKTSSNFRVSEIKPEENIPYGKEKGRSNYHSDNKGNKSSSKYGGWDELEKKQTRPDKVPRRAPIQNTDGFSKQEGKSKLSRRVRNRDTPLLLRLLVAAFPFLGSWTRLLL